MGGLRGITGMTALVLAMWIHGAAAQDGGPRGALRGRAIDIETLAPVPGAAIVVTGTRLGGVTDAEGNFAIADVPVGSYVVEARLLGYASRKYPDVIIRSGRATVLQCDLKAVAIEVAGATVSGGYYNPDEISTAGITAFSGEEIRRSPGSAGDISRIIQGLPGIAKANDERNNLIVRGGSPIENAFFVDNIEFPNINHFPTQGSSGGAVGILNIDLVKDVTFRTGGFSASYGDRLSSIMEIALRDGNRERLEGQAELSMAGAGLVLEGPLGAGGSWLLSARRSYVDILADIMNLGVAPKYGDAQLRAVYDIDASNRVTVNDVFGLDLNTITRENARDLDFSVYGKDDQMQNTAGVNWRRLWRNGWSNTSVSHSLMTFTTDFLGGRSDSLVIRNRSTEQFVQLRNVDNLRLVAGQRTEFGVDAKVAMLDYDIDFGASATLAGDPDAAYGVRARMTAVRAGAHATHTVTVAGTLDVSAGARVDWSSYTSRATVSPRLSLCLRLSDVTTVTASTGIYHQSLPWYFLAQNTAYKSMAEMRSVHYILGFNHQLTGDVKFGIEAYHKAYTHFPMNPAQPTIFAIDEIFYGSPYFYKENGLIDAGRAVASGIEATLQKKLARDFYGLASVSYAAARYEGLDGVWRDRVFSNRLLFSVEGGYKPDERWEFSLRWIYAGGTPYTPFDIAASTAEDRGILDAARTNAMRNPDYHALNVRVDRRFNFASTNLVVYLSVWNAYNRRNVASHYWNEFDNVAAEQLQWSTMPIVGVEYEF